jgi:hypothetical protein
MGRATTGAQFASPRGRETTEAILFPFTVFPLRAFGVFAAEVYPVSLCLLATLSLTGSIIFFADKHLNISHPGNCDFTVGTGIIIFTEIKVLPETEVINLGYEKVIR